MLENIWNSLLELKRILDASDPKDISILVSVNDEGSDIRIDSPEKGLTSSVTYVFSNTDESSLVFNLNEKFDLVISDNVPISAEYRFIENYLPYCFSALKGRRLKRAFAITHYAQSLDGKIATSGGNSKWISDEENLVHCHRMRALCDGIIIGINTLRNDKPQLTVRHVKGNNPVKIVIGSSSSSFSSLLHQKEKVLLFTSNSAKVLQGVEQIEFPEKVERPVFILQQLYKMGIRSVFIEGGSFTTSSFLISNMTDEIQLFIAPTIFGSGLQNFELPIIKHVKDALTFSKYNFQIMGKGVLFKGEVKYRAKGTDHQ
jgi:diaminohydroxyphosphoribosylaminopyrimidine deaminase/5-amino-6-(5-phosphoribosylamino)uracil reductase